MRIIFLDIDGVLNSWRTVLADMPAPGFDPVACRLMTWILRGADAKFVVCSAWREGRTRSEIESILGEAGLPTDRLHVDWATPKLDGPRSEEIMAWLSDHAAVGRWCVIDDGIGLDAVADRWVPTDLDDGLTLNDVLRVCALLGWNPRSELARKGGLRLSAAESLWFENTDSPSAE